MRSEQIEIRCIELQTMQLEVQKMFEEMFGAEREAVNRRLAVIFEEYNITEEVEAKQKQLREEPSKSRSAWLEVSTTKQSVALQCIADASRPQEQLEILRNRCSLDRKLCEHGCCQLNDKSPKLYSLRSGSASKGSGSGTMIL